MENAARQAGNAAEILEPGLPICDPHHHLWDAPGRSYLIKELFADIGGGHNIVQTVFVESESAKQHDTIQRLQPVAETRFVHDITAQAATLPYGRTRVAAGIVGFADLRLGDEVGPVLEAHLAASDRFRGIRQICSWHQQADIFHSSTDPGLLLDARFRQGFARLPHYKITFETFIYHPQLDELIDLAQKFPAVPIILNHLGGPLGAGPYAGQRQEVFREWQAKMTTLAACPNVYVKLGGIGMPICGFGWNERPNPPDYTEVAAAVRPYFLHCLEKFGTGRCMFESNFPVDKMSYPYATLWNAFKYFSKDFTAAERADLFYNTAVRTYRLPAGNY